MFFSIRTRMTSDGVVLMRPLMNSPVNPSSDTQSPSFITVAPLAEFTVMVRAW